MKQLEWESGTLDSNLVYLYAKGFGNAYKIRNYKLGPVDPVTRGIEGKFSSLIER